MPLRRLLRPGLVVAALCWALATVGAPAAPGSSGTKPVAKPVMILVPGGFAGGWTFSRLEPYLRDRGYDVRSVTLTGLGERFHLASPDIGLQTHIDDVVNMILFEDLHDVILLGHSYGGMIITGVADRIPDRVSRLVYLDALLPKDGECVLDVIKEGDFKSHLKDGMVVPWWVTDTTPYPRDMPQSYKTFTDPIHLTNPDRARIPAVYILTVDPGKQPAQDGMYPCAQRARALGWPMLVLPGSHNAHWDDPADTAIYIAGGLEALPH